MGFWTLFEVASMPILQVLLISILGALMATDYLKLLHSDARRSLNKIVFVVFTPSLMFASLAKTVTLDDIISWWFMPINIGLTFLVGGILGWLVVKILKPDLHLEGLIIATCSAGNLGNLLLIVIPAICKEKRSPFGDHGICASVGLSYASFSMAVGGFYIWTHTYHLIRSSSVKFKALKAAEEDALKKPNNDFDANEKSHLLEEVDQNDLALSIAPTKSTAYDPENQTKACEKTDMEPREGEVSSWSKFLHKIVEELLAPPTVAAIIGLIFGSVTWLKNLIIFPLLSFLLSYSTRPFILLVYTLHFPPNKLFFWVSNDGYFNFLLSEICGLKVGVFSFSLVWFCLLNWVCFSWFLPFWVSFTGCELKSQKFKRF